MLVRMGFFDYTPLIYAATDNSFLLYYTRPSCIDIRLGHLSIITIILTTPSRTVLRHLMDYLGRPWFYIIGSSGCFPWTLVITHFPNYVSIITQGFNNSVRTEVFIG